MINIAEDEFDKNFKVKEIKQQFLSKIKDIEVQVIPLNVKSENEAKDKVMKFLKFVRTDPSMKFLEEQNDKEKKRC